MNLGILWPTLAMVALIFGVFLTMFVTRAGHIKRNPPRAADFASGEAALRYFAPVEMPANNYRNLFEMPVLFFALVPLLIVTGEASFVQTLLAWIYVGLRAAHSVVHIGPKNIPWRATLFVISTVLLAVMWIGFAVDAISTQIAFDVAARKSVGA